MIKVIGIRDELILETVTRHLKFHNNNNNLKATEIGVESEVMVVTKHDIQHACEVIVQEGKESTTFNL